jgi:hypothetical protein
MTAPATPDKRATAATHAPTEGDKAACALHSGTQNTFIAKIFAEGKLDTTKGSCITGPLDFSACCRQMDKKGERVLAGNLKELEWMLMGQATALQAMFMEMSRRAALNMGTYLGPMETYMRLALKAQAQCRHTVETLAEIKNPRPIYINPKQVNHSTGPQQVNNAGGLQQVNNGSSEPATAALNAHTVDNDAMVVKDGEPARVETGN